MATFYNIVHKTDKAFAPWHASTYEYACKLFTCILDKKPELSGQLEIVAVSSMFLGSKLGREFLGIK